MALAAPAGGGARSGHTLAAASRAGCFSAAAEKTFVAGLNGGDTVAAVVRLGGEAAARRADAAAAAAIGLPAFQRRDTQ